MHIYNKLPDVTNLFSCRIQFVITTFFDLRNRDIAEYYHNRRQRRHRWAFYDGTNKHNKSLARLQEYIPFTHLKLVSHKQCMLAFRVNFNSMCLLLVINSMHANAFSFVAVALQVPCFCISSITLYKHAKYCAMHTLCQQSSLCVPCNRAMLRQHCIHL